MPPSAYLPDDARIAVAAIEALHSPAGAKLRAAITALPDPERPTVAQISALRKTFPANLLHAGLALAALQIKGHLKFPELSYVWTTPEALEQASGIAVARHKASRFRAASVANILDFCCGIGGDALALAEVAPVTAVDLSPVRTACLRYNLEQISRPHPVEIQTADIRTVSKSVSNDAFFHIDPSRRHSATGGKTQRSAQYEDLIPGPEVVEALITRFAGGVLKLSPAVNFSDLPPGHVELVSQHGTVLQALLWTGRFTEKLPVNRRTATIVGTSPWSFTGDIQSSGEAPMPVEPMTGYLYELDGTLTRGGLATAYAATKGLTPLTPDGGYLHANALITDPPLTTFQILTTVPFSEPRVAEALAHLPESNTSGPIEVKTRGGLPGINTDQLQKTWTQTAPRNLTVLLFRHHDDVLAVIAKRLAAPL